MYPQFRRPDIEAPRHKKARPVMTSEDVDRRFPTVEYSAWRSAHSTESQESADRASTHLQRAKSRDGGHADLPDTNTQPSREGDNQNETPSSDGGDSRSMCAICVDQFDSNDEVRPLTCGHIFHPACIDMWLTKRQACCPLCKTLYVGVRASSDSQRQAEAEASAMPAPPAAAVLRDARVPERTLVLG